MMKRLMPWVLCAVFSAAVSGSETLCFENSFEKSAEGWNTPKYWNGKLTRENGEMRLEATARNGQNFGRCTKMVLPHRHLNGAIFELAFDASGKGSVTVGTMVFPAPPLKPRIVEHGRIALSDGTKRVRQKIDLSQTITDRIALTLEIPAGSRLVFDNVKLTKLADDAVKIDDPEIPVMRGRAADIAVRTNAPGKAFTVFCGAKKSGITADADGKVTIPAALIGLAADGSAEITVARNGTQTTFQTSVVPEKEFDQALADAAKIGRKSVSAVWFGDSELDFDRGRNTPAQVNFYLNAAKIRASYRNFAVAGDHLRRVDARFAGRYAPRPDAYKDAPACRPDLVFVMLGHNDTMTSSKDGYASSLVPPALQLTLGRSVLRRIRTLYPRARTILVSPLALDDGFLKAKADARTAAGAKNVFRFGKTENMREFCKIWKALADEFGLEFLDVYAPLAAVPGRRKFFKPGDEVHLNAAGHVRLTGEILKYLAQNPKWSAVKEYVSAENFVFSAADLKSGEFARGSASAAVSGKTAFADGALLMDGKTNAVAVSGVAGPDLRRGFTLDLVFETGKPEGNSAVDLSYDAFFYAPGSFVLARYQRSFYFLYFDGKKYQKGFLTPAVFTEKTAKVHHAAMSCRYHEAVDQGEIWTEIQLFVDGKALPVQKLPNVKLVPPPGAWEFGAASRFGSAWNFGGKIYGGGCFNRVLTEKEIRDRVLTFGGVVTPAFQKSARVTEARLEKIAADPDPARRSALMNLAKSGFSDFDRVADSPGKFLFSAGSEKVLTILTSPGAVRILSLYDRKNGRELFNWNNVFFRLHFIRGNEKAVLGMNDLENVFLSPPVEKNGVLEFAVSHKRRAFPAVSGRSRWRFDGTRLEFSLDATSETYATVLEKVTLPALNIAPLDKGAALVVPEAGGLLYPDAASRRIAYDGIYPRMLTSMQFGAVYDGRGGVYFSPADPLGRVKYYSFRADSDGTEVKIDYPVSFAARNKKNSFSSKCSAVVELFSGDWYDAGLIYRSELARTGALWWRKTLPDTDTPEWFRRNTLALLVFHIPDPEQAITLREYLGLGYTIQHWYWWERGPGHHLCPIPRANAEYIAYAKLMKKYGIRVLSYTNGRLWSTRDRRGESTLYRTLGTAAAVKTADGKVQLEPYGVPCAVLCPASDIYRQAMFGMVTRLVAQGISGCFIDQLGAARPILCQVPGHGHGINDPESWNVNGHRKAFLPIREYWRKNGIDAVMSTEDNSEHCVGLVDALCPWRWMHDHQVPLHAMVYSGRTQYTSRDPVGADPAAAFVKAAVQLVQGEQIGHFGIVEITSPARGVFRRYLKRLCHLRTGAIDFFDRGLMKRPPVLAGLGKKIYTRWGNHGTKDVGTLPVVSGAWELDGNTIVLLVNTTGGPRSGRLASPPRDLRKVWRSGEGTESETAFSIGPYGCELRLYGKTPDAELVKRIDSSFAVIRRTFTEKDPFGVDKVEFGDTPPFDATRRQNAAASPLVLGARVNRDLMVLDNVFFGVFFAGTGDFGKPSKGCFEVEIAAPSYSGGGSIEILTGHPDSGELAGRLILDRKNVLTDSFGDYRKFRIPALRTLGGRNKIFFKLNGGSVCNFRSWRYIPEGK
ncbi:MAG: hypothetical protein IJU70_06590 [Lentisphaeria bacterium]|nr:hypothetical protein [Lentisphaeria bacterium]